jgi:hypothetical protein
MDSLQEVIKFFKNYSVETQRDLMWNYILYVTRFPEEHDEGSYPVSFWEWFQNDFGGAKLEQF